MDVKLILCVFSFLIFVKTKLLNQIVESFPAGMKNKSSKAGFLRTFDQILEGVEKQKEQVEKDYDMQRAMLDSLKAKHSAATAAQRAYFKVRQIVVVVFIL